MCGYFFTEFMDVIIKSTSFLGYTHLFSSSGYGNNDKILLKLF